LAIRRREWEKLDARFFAGRGHEEGRKKLGMRARGPGAGVSTRGRTLGKGRDGSRLLFTHRRGVGRRIWGDSWVAEGLREKKNEDKRHEHWSKNGRIKKEASVLGPWGGKKKILHKRVRGVGNRPSKKGEAQGQNSTEIGRQGTKENRCHFTWLIVKNNSRGTALRGKNRGNSKP